MWYAAFGGLALSQAIVTAFWAVLRDKLKFKKTTRHEIFRWWMVAFSLICLLSGILCYIGAISALVFAFLPLGVMISLILLILVIYEN